MFGHHFFPARMDGPRYFGPRVGAPGPTSDTTFNVRDRVADTDFAVQEGTGEDFEVV